MVCVGPVFNKQSFKKLLLIACLGYKNNWMENSILIDNQTAAVQWNWKKPHDMTVPAKGHFMQIPSVQFVMNLHYESFPNQLELLG